MAEKEDKSLIGFDPLAWMNEEASSANNKSDDSEQQPMIEDESNQYKTEIIEEPEDVVVEAEIITEAFASIDPEKKQDSEDSEINKVVLNATLNIQGVTELYEQLLKLLEAEDVIEIDASAVVTVDTSTFQLLIVLKQTAIKLGKQVTIDFPSDRFVESAELVGLSEMLEVDQSAAGFF